MFGVVPVVPGVSFAYHLLVDIASLQQNSADGAAVCIDIDDFDFDLFAQNFFTESITGNVAAGLIFFRGVDAVKADFVFAVALRHQQHCRVAVINFDDLSGQNFADSGFAVSGTAAGEGFNDLLGEKFFIFEQLDAGTSEYAELKQ